MEVGESDGFIPSLCCPDAGGDEGAGATIASYKLSCRFHIHLPTEGLCLIKTGNTSAAGLTSSHHAGEDHLTRATVFSRAKTPPPPRPGAQIRSKHAAACDPARDERTG